MSSFGLCGKTLKHSYSEIIHNLLGNHDYKLLNMSKEEFYDFMKKREFCGVNVTIPYKTDALAACDSVSPEAAKIGSVNTVINRNGRLYGYNTDYFGFSYMLDSAGIDVIGKKALVLGTGGTSLTARHVLADRKAARFSSCHAPVKSTIKTFTNTPTPRSSSIPRRSACSRTTAKVPSN